MTHPQLSRRASRSYRGFTLIEVLVVIGIIVVLVAIALPALNAARRSGKRTAISQQIAMLETGLTAFEQDHKKPPQVIIEQNGATAMNVGFGVLGAALVGPGGATTQPTSPTAPKKASAPVYVAGKEYLVGDCVSTTGTAEFIALQRTSGQPPGPQTEYWQSFVFSDGKNGYGIDINGKTWGPYIQPDKLKMRGAAILDVEDNPIAYVPARSVKNNVRVPLHTGGGSYVDFLSDLRASPQYDATPNYPLFVRTGEPLNEKILNLNDRNKALKRMQLYMGAVPHDASPNPGCLDPKKDPVDVPYLLWSAGLDGKYGPDLDTDPVKQQRLIDKCDDLTNFRR